MGNSFVVTMEFFFKGEKYTPSATINLDEYMRRDVGFPPFYTILARANGIDPYSYQYEMMEMEEASFSKATGFVVDYLADGVLDMDGLQRRWHEEEVLKIVREIAQRTMDIDDLGLHPELKSALVEAYQSGKSVN